MNTDGVGRGVSTLDWESRAMNKKSSKVFLSYAASDREPARKIAEHLRGAGFQVWDPELEILPGDDFSVRLKQALETVEAFVVLISPEALESRWISYELGYVLGEKRFRGRLVPVTIRPAKNAPWILNSLPSVQYEGPAKTGKQIADLLSQPADVAETKWRA